MYLAASSRRIGMRPYRRSACMSRVDCESINRSSPTAITSSAVSEMPATAAKPATIRPRGDVITMSPNPTEVIA
jgi:hypothetical protein